MDFGGIERGVCDFSIKAKELGHDVTVTSGAGRFIPILREKGIKWHDVSMDRKNLSTFIISRRLLQKIIDKEKPDIVHVQSRFPCWIAASLMQKFPGLPWVSSIHSFNRFGLYSRSEGRGNLVITVSNALKRHAVEYLKIPQEKIRIVYNGISDEFTLIRKNNSGRICIGMIARFSLYKGHYVFLEAVKVLKKKLELRALIVGSGSNSYKNHLESWILKNGLNETVDVIRMDSAEALKNIDILVVPSFVPEGFGRTVVEAQMSKTVVIGTDIGAIPELIEDCKTGFLVKPGDYRQIAEKIAYIIENPEILKPVVQNAYENAMNNFTVDIMVKKTLNVYNELLKGKQ